MADAQLKAVITAEDKASKVIESVSGSLNKAQGALDKAKGASQAFALGLAGVAAAGLAAASKAIGAAQESVLMEKQLEAVLKSTSHAAGLFKEDILEQAAALQKLTNFGDEAIVSSANLLLTFTNIKGPIMQQAIETTLDMSAALGQDLKSSAIQLGKALNDPVEGINALRRVGVSFSDDQQKVIGQLVKTGQTAKAQQVILNELAKEFGGSARAQAEPIAQLKNAIGEAWEAIGKELLPIVNRFAQSIQRLVDEHIQEWISKTKDVINFLREHKEVIIIIGGAILGALVPAIYAAVVAFGALALTLAPWLIGGAIIGGLVAGILWIVKHWEDIKAKALEIWGAITGYLQDQWNKITEDIRNAWNSIKEFFSIVWDGITAAFKFYVAFVTGLVILAFKAMGIDIVAVFETVKSAISSAWEWIEQAFSTSLQFIAQTWNTAWSAISGFLSPIWEAVKNVIAAAWNWIKGKFDESTKPVRDSWNSLWTGLKDIVGNVWDWITNKIKEGVNATINEINKLIGGINSIANLGAKAIGISIPNIPNIKPVNDAIISPRGQIITTHPDDYLIATKNPYAFAGAGAPITINFNNSTFMGREGIAEQIGNDIMKILKRNVRL